MNITLIIEYLKDLKTAILEEKENSRYLAHKVLVLIDRLKMTEREKRELYINGLFVRDKKGKIIELKS